MGTVKRNLLGLPCREDLNPEMNMFGMKPSEVKTSRKVSVQRWNLVVGAVCFLAACGVQATGNGSEYMWLAVVAVWSGGSIAAATHSVSQGGVDKITAKMIGEQPARE